MATEIETKVLDINATAIMKRLKALGAKQTSKSLLIVDWYRPSGVKEGKDPWYLRIRSYDGKRHEVTWKAKSNIVGKTREHKEINFMIEEPKQLADLFIELTLEAYAHQEKKRTSFRYKKWNFDIDVYPGMPAFMEIEGVSEKHVEQAIKLLGLEGNRTWAEGERTLIQKIYGLDWYEMRF